MPKVYIFLLNLFQYIYQSHPKLDLLALHLIQLMREVSLKLRALLFEATSLLEFHGLFKEM